jgi:Uma2 family endonuclease
MSGEQFGMSEMAIAYERRLISVDDYHRMYEAGVFAPDERVELVDGELIAVPPMGPRHAGAIGRLTRLFTSRLGDRVLVRVQLPVIVDDRSEPEPEFVLVPPDPYDYADRHPQPADVLLLVEVSDSSRDFDRRKKVPLYARAGIHEVWLLDVVDRRLLVFRDPSGGAYRTKSTLAQGNDVAMLAFPDERFTVAEILGPQG